MGIERQKELAKNTVILTIGRVCTQGVSFLLLPLYTTLLTPDEYGIVDLFNTYISILIPLVSWEFDLGAFRFLLEVRDSFKEQKKVISTIISTHFIQNFVYLILFLGISPFIHSEFKIFLFLDVIANVFLNTLLQVSRGVNRNIVYSFASFLSASSTVVLNVFTIALLKFGALGMFISSFLGKVIAIIYLVVILKIWKYYSIKCFSKKLLKNISKYSLPCIPTQLSWWVVNASDRTIIAFFLGVTKNGIYSVANKFSSIYITFYNILNLSWTEMTVLHINDEDRDEFFSLMINTIFSIFAAICLIIISVIPFVYRIMVDSQYADGYFQVPILMIAVLCQVVCGLYSTIYLAAKKTTESAKTAFLAAIINIVVDILLIKVIGLYAASISTLVAYFSMAVYRYFDSKKYIKMVLNFKILMSTILIAFLDILIVYYNHTITSAINVLIVIVYSCLLNKNMIQSCLIMVKNKILNSW